MSDRPNKFKPCRRCGVDMQWQRKAKLPGVCRDCRASDPAYVDALLSGSPLVARTAS